MGTVNERLRTAMMRSGVTVEDLSLCCAVDPKTIERWLSPGRVPHRTHRWTAARRLGYDENYLWPDARRPAGRRAEATQGELVRLYPDRASVPREVWLRMLNNATEHVDVLFFSGTFYAQTQPRIAQQLADAAARGVALRLCFGDPISEAVATRDREEGLGGTLTHKICSTQTYYRQLADVPNCQMRLHSTACTRRCSATTTRSWWTPTPTANPPQRTRPCTCADWTAGRSPSTT